LEQSQPGQLIVRVLHNAEVAEDVLHVRLLEEPQAAPDVERDIATLEFELDLQRVPMAAIENRDIVQCPALIEQVQDVLRNEPRLREMVLAWDDGRLEPRGSDRPEI